jgi:hypothetical protein
MRGRRVFLVEQTDSTPWPWPAPTPSKPDMVVCPVMMLPGFLPAPQEIYRLAYERALAASQPSRYELAMAVSPN